MFRISQWKHYWVMTVPTLMIPEYKMDPYESPDVNLLDSIVETVIEELEGRVGVKRMSYDTWHWTNQNEMERFLTYYYLKYGSQYPIDRTTA